MSNATHLSIDYLAEEIMAYLRGNPNAKDTLSGVLQWWMLRQRYLQSLAQVESALDKLINQGLVRRERLPDGSFLYSAGHAGEKG